MVVNEAFEAKPDFGKLLLLQTKQAEMFVRRYELWPLGKAPTDELRQSQSRASAPSVSLQTHHR